MQKGELLRLLNEYKGVISKRIFSKESNYRIKWLESFLETVEIKALKDDTDTISYAEFDTYLKNNNLPKKEYDDFFSAEFLNGKAESKTLFKKLKESKQEKKAELPTLEKANISDEIDTLLAHESRPATTKITDVFPDEELSKRYQEASAFCESLSDEQLQAAFYFPEKNLDESLFKDNKGKMLYDILTKGYDKSADPEKKVMAQLYSAAVGFRLYPIHDDNGNNNPERNLIATVMYDHRKGRCREDNLDLDELIASAAKLSDETKTLLIKRFLAASSINKVSLRINSIDEGKTALSILKNDTRITSLDWRWLGGIPTQESYKLLIELLKENIHLTSIAVVYVKGKENSKTLLTLLEQHPSLTTIELYGNDLPASAEAMEFFKSKHPSKNISLILPTPELKFAQNRNQRDIKALDTFLSPLQTTLNTKSSVPLTNPDDINATARMILKNYPIETLSLNFRFDERDNSRISPASMQALGLSLRSNTKLRDLTMSAGRFDIDPDGMTYITDALRHNSTLRSLNIGKLPLSEDASKALVDALSVNKSLTSLNCMAKGDVQEIAMALRTNHTMREVRLYNDKGDLDGNLALAEMLKHNNTITTLETEYGFTDSGDVIHELTKCNKTLLPFEDFNKLTTHDIISQTQAKHLDKTSLSKLIKTKEFEQELEKLVAISSVIFRIANELPSKLDEQISKLLTLKDPNETYNEIFTKLYDCTVKINYLNEVKEYVSQKANAWFNDKVEWLKENGCLEAAMDMYLSIPASDPGFYRARFDAYSIAYDAYLDADKSNKLEAFFDSLPMLFDDKNHLIELKKDHDIEKLFCYHLKGAIGIDAKLTENTLPNEIQLAMLQYATLLQLVAIKSDHQPTMFSAAAAQNIGRQKLAGVYQEIAALPKITKAENFTDSMRENVTKLWQKSMEVKSILSQTQKAVIEPVLGMQNKFQPTPPENQPTQPTLG